LKKTKFFDEDLEVEHYELWYYEGRRARFGAAMTAPDYTIKNPAAGTGCRVLFFSVSAKD